MDIKGFQVWLSAARGLTRAQRREALAVLSGRSEGEASKAAIELGVDEARRCPHCASEGAVSRGMARGLRRYQCKGCGRTFNALTGTPLSGLHHKERWLSFGASLAKGETVKASAARCDVAVSTAFRWRHRFLAAARSDSEVLKGIVEADETYVLESRKGARGLGRKARRRGGKAKKRGLSREQVPVLMAADRSGTTVSAVLPRVDAAALAAALDPVVAKDALLVSDGGASYPPCAAALGVSHEALNRSMGERVRGDLHVQTVNSRHSRLKDFLRPRRGIATRYLDNYLSWFHLVGLAPGVDRRADSTPICTLTCWIRSIMRGQHSTPVNRLTLERREGDGSGCGLIVRASCGARGSRRSWPGWDHCRSCKDAASWSVSDRLAVHHGALGL